MGDKSPKAKEKSKKQDSTDKKKKPAADTKASPLPPAKKGK